MYRVNRNGINLYRFKTLSSFPQLQHGITTRLGGSSAAPFDSLNLATRVGDADAHVAANRRRVWAQFPPATPVYLNQVHSRNIAVWEGETRWAKHAGSQEADAVVTDRFESLLTILVADCQAVMLYDPVSSVVANIHSGWRGSIANIIGRTVDRMKERFGCEPVNIHAGIGPSLGPCCSEFVNFRSEIPEALWQYRISEFHFDFWALSRDQLVQTGLPADQVETGGICTRCRSDEFYSYRAARQTGRMAAVIGMIAEPNQTS